jgi:hypothetical protein
METRIAREFGKQFDAVIESIHARYGKAAERALWMHQVVPPGMDPDFDRLRDLQIEVVRQIAAELKRLGTDG